MRERPAVAWKRLGLAAAAVAIALALIVALQPRPVPVDIAVVRPGPMEVTVDEEGKTRIKDVYVVSAPVAGKVLRSPVEPGDPVKKSETVVVVMEPTAPSFLDARSRRESEAAVEAARAAVRLAEAELKQMEAELTFAQSELERSRRLSRSNVIPERQSEKARTDFERQAALVTRAKANLELRRRELESAQARLIGPETDPEAVPGGPSTMRTCCVSVRSPVNGRVLKRHLESERVVPAGTPLLDIGDPTNLEVVVDLLSSDAVRIRTGAAAVIEGTGLTEPLSGRVRLIEPAGFTKISALGIEEQRVRTILDLTAPRASLVGLGHEYRVFVRISAWSAQSVIRVPIGALFRSGDRWAVFVTDGRYARHRPIEIGHRNSAFAEVVSGLKSGERIILHPSDRISDGVRIEQRADGR